MTTSQIWHVVQQNRASIEKLERHVYEKKCDWENSEKNETTPPEEETTSEHSYGYFTALNPFPQPEEEMDIDFEPESCMALEDISKFLHEERQKNDSLTLPGGAAAFQTFSTPVPTVKVTRKCDDCTHLLKKLLSQEDLRVGTGKKRKMAFEKQSTSTNESKNKDSGPERSYLSYRSYNFHCNRSYKHRKTITDIVFYSENKILSPEKAMLAASENTFVLIFCHFQRLSLYDLSSSKTTSIQNNRTRIIWRLFN